MENNVKIRVENLYKIFGHNPEKAFPLIKKGMERSGIHKKTGNVVAVRGVSFDIKAKETFVIMGLSGSGKSTLIRCMNRLIDSTSGKIMVDGENILEMDREELKNLRRYKMSMVFQNFGLLPHRNVLSNVEFGLEISGVEKAARVEKAMAAIELVGLSGIAIVILAMFLDRITQALGSSRK